MPGVALHFHLADHALHSWRARVEAPPFDADDPVALNAFYHGAVGPDLGYFPGGRRILSDLAHCVRTGALARVLIRSARTVRERAFAWGWLTHFLADRAVHPLIGQGVGELLTGSRDRFVDGSSHPLAHLRVEMGVDAAVAERAPEVRRRRLSDVFDADSVGFLVRAYATTYGVAVAPEEFLRSHRATTRRVGQALGSMGVMAALMRGTGFPVVPVIRGALQAAYRNSALRSLSLAYLNPVPPAPWLMEAVDQQVARYSEVFMEHYASGAADLPDVNLDTGRPLDLEDGHPGTLRALEGLTRLAEHTEGTRTPVPAVQEDLLLPAVLGSVRRPAEA